MNFKTIYSLHSVAKEINIFSELSYNKTIMSTQKNIPIDTTKTVTDEKESYAYSTSVNVFLPKTIKDLLDDSATSTEIAYIFYHEGNYLIWK